MAMEADLGAIVISNPPLHQTGDPERTETHSPDSMGDAPEKQVCPHCRASGPVQAQPQVQTTTVVTSFGSYPVRINCSNCNTEQMTVIRRKIGVINWMVCGFVALVLLILGVELFIPFLLIPFAFIALCIPALKDVEHVCPNCNYINGIHRAM